MDEQPLSQEGDETSRGDETDLLKNKIIFFEQEKKEKKKKIMNGWDLMSLGTIEG